MEDRSEASAPGSSSREDLLKGAQPAGAGSPRGSVVAVIVSISALAALVWAISPNRPSLTPAPLRPVPPGCGKFKRDFVPTNFTDLPDSAAGQLSRAVKYRVLYRLNMNACQCGCRQSIVSCRFNYPGCETSPVQVRRIIEEEERKSPSLSPGAFQPSQAK